MSKTYSKIKALGAITKASFLATLKNPQAIVFSLIFPLVFVFIFGAFGGGGLGKFKLAVSPSCDTTNLLFKALAKQPFINFIRYSDTALMRSDLEKGRLIGVIEVKETKIEEYTLPMTARNMQKLCYFFVAEHYIFVKKSKRTCIWCCGEPNKKSIKIV